MTARFQGIVRRLSPLILLLACGLPAQAQDRAALQQQLSERVDQIYQLFVSGDWSKVDAYITDDSRNIWLAQAKNTIEAFEIDELTVAPDGQKADVTVMISYRIPQAPGAPFTQPQKTEWLHQGGEWFVQLKPPPSPMDLFTKGATAVKPAAPKPAFRFDQNPVSIARPAAGFKAVVKVPFENVTTEVVTLQDVITTCPCLQAKVDQAVIDPGGKGVLTITYLPSEAPSFQQPLSVRAVLAPSNYVLDLPVVIK